MNSPSSNTESLEWPNIKDLHADSIRWLSELNFIDDECLFFDDMIKTYTINLIDQSIFEKTKVLIGRLSQIQTKNKELINEISKHENSLDRLIQKSDNTNRAKVYTNEHKELLNSIRIHWDNYKPLKKDLFELLKGVLAEQKKKLLLNS